MVYIWGSALYFIHWSMEGVQAVHILGSTNDTLEKNPTLKNIKGLNSWNGMLNKAHKKSVQKRGSRAVVRRTTNGA